MYKGRIFTREITYSCGDYLDGSIFPVFQKPGVRRKKSKPSSDIQARLNRTNSMKYFVRLIHLNFSKDDYELTPTYDDDHLPETYEQAERDVKNFIRRIKRAWKKSVTEKELKYCYRIDVSEDGRYHAHMYITGGLDRNLLEDLWGKGWANTVRLIPRNDGLTGLSEYISGKDIIDENGKRISYRRWSRSKNFILPEGAVRDGAVSQSQVKEIINAFERRDFTEYFESLYPGYRLVEARLYQNGINRGNYIYFQMVKSHAYKDTVIEEYQHTREASLYIRGMTRKRKLKSNASKTRSAFDAPERREKWGQTGKV